MVARLIVSVLLVGACCGAVWYVIREAPGREIVELRQVSESLLEDLEDHLAAEEVNAEILAILPDSVRDLVFRGRVNERKGTNEGLQTALKLYDRVLDMGHERHLGVALLKARVLRKLGQLHLSQSILLSIVDSFPYQAYMQLGHVARQGLATEQAIERYAHARSIATSALEEVRALVESARAAAAASTANTGASRAADGAPSEPSPAGSTTSAAEQWHQRARSFLDDAVDRLDRLRPADSVDEERIRLWLGAIAREQSELKLTGETPARDMVERLQLRDADHKGLVSNHQPRLAIMKGVLHLYSALEASTETVDSTGIRERSLDAMSREFSTALRLDPAQARQLLSESPAPRTDGAPPRRVADPHHVDPHRVDRHRYLRDLRVIALKVLRSPLSSRLILDDSPLQLARRIEDAAANGGGDTSTFALLRAYAGLKYKGSQHATVRSTAVQELRRFLFDAGPRSAVELLAVAENLLTNDVPSPLLVDCLEQLSESVEDPLQFLGRRVDLLLRVRQQVGGLEEWAGKRLETVFDAAIGSADTAAKERAVLRAYRRVYGLQPALQLCRSRVEDVPGAGLRLLFGDWLAQRASQSGGDAEEAAATDLAEALGHYIVHLVDSPTAGERAADRAAQLLATADRPARGVPAPVRRLFPAASESQIEAFFDAACHFLTGRFEEALAASQPLDQITTFQPFLSFLRGSCHVGVASRLESGDAARSATERADLEFARERELQFARREFDRFPQYLANALELLELDLSEGTASWSTLALRLDQLGDDPRAGYRIHWLRALLITGRFRDAYHARDVKNSEVARLLIDQREALRLTLTLAPGFTAASLLLAESFVICEQEERRLRRSEGRGRQLYAADYGRAISALRAVAHPTPSVLLRLGQYLVANGDFEAAMPALESVARSQPSSEVFVRLFDLYLNRDEAALEAILSERPATENLQTLQDRFLAVSDHAYLRHTFLGQLYGKRASTASNAATRRAWAERQVESYENALRAAESSGRVLPVSLLSDLASRLVEDDDPKRRERGLEIANRARDRVLGADQAAQVFETYGWALYRNGKLLEAKRVYDELTKTTRRPRALYKYARVLFDLKEYNEASSVLTLALNSSEFVEREEARRLLQEVRLRSAEKTGQKAN